MDWADLVPRPTQDEWHSMGYIFIAMAIVCYYLSVFAWRLALRDTNAEKRMRILKGLDIDTKRPYVFIAFLHPFCNAGGGGERVLFEAIRVQQQDPYAICVVYTGDIQPLPNGVAKEEILAKAKERFGITLRPEAVAFLPLHNRHFVEGSYWRHFTLLGQAFGANRLGYAAMSELVPDVFIDTMGYAFALSAVKHYSKEIRIGAYVHYPTISTDMLQRVRSRKAGITNSGWIATSYPLSYAKLIYYRLFALAYGRALRNADVIVANGTWTRNHIESLVQCHIKRPWSVHVPSVEIVYPPCNTQLFSELPLQKRQMRQIVSLAQFRPEKDHALQLRIIHQLLQKHSELKKSRGNQQALKLILIGGCRNAEDEERVRQLKELAKELVIENHVEWCINAPLETVIEKLRGASLGLSTMVDEHFGINVVEYMAAGLIPLSHASAGPLLDVSVPVDGQPTGFHAKNLDNYVTQAYELLTLSEAKALDIRERARNFVQNTFSDESFDHAWRKHLWDKLVAQSLTEQDTKRQITVDGSHKISKGSIKSTVSDSAKDK
ncbi:GDP-Man:Man3GlcNAc2-PP-dolichol alpha-1,2-mannosyltransferase [Malassezia psittaci]|uniref:GDP-Man:Man(3)GlcNAc(2)-PP-Dol alpha-1,2-mannosyltransferase n=1 Tax=Malassezia psittaci TaxID=1821823 RepID=A0AAF0F7A9_9BASI|nr:GDP-Man:Man3GlcNAc2-PP-dolichol alpha-1,2-mannosyltransferase [Malassezia psittaci]